MFVHLLVSFTAKIPTKVGLYKKALRNICSTHELDVACLQI